MLADIESLNKRSVLLEKKIRGNDKEAKNQFEMVEKALVILNEGRSAREYQLEKGEEKAFRMLQLLTAKPVLYVCNVEEAAAAEGNALSAMVVERAIEQKAQAVIISAKIEDEVSNLPNESEKSEYLESMGLAETGLSRVIRAGYNLLDLLTFFTSGPKESRAWTLCNSARAPEAAGVIHSDFERGFIKAETISFEDFIDFNGEQGAKEAGKMRQEGKDYFVVDGDIILFKFNV
jgi:GTP-binding protein YchF